MTDPTAPPPHDYVSTACFHDEHGACRKTCKYCDASCSCRDCDHAVAADLPAPWVDQARDIARELLRYGLSGSEAVPPELLRRIESDPALFWLRGEAAPPGEWHGEPRRAGDVTMPPPGFLTDAERQAVRVAGELYTFIERHVCGNGPTRAADLAEIAARVHDIQYRVTGQAAARLYPGELRLMGEVTGGEPDAAPKPPEIALLEEALHLRMNGEYAPGGNENWHDWDLRAEVFLRGLLPPEAGDPATADPRT